jgi:hypothetical protein
VKHKKARKATGNIEPSRYIYISLTAVVIVAAPLIPACNIIIIIIIKEIKHLYLFYFLYFSNRRYACHPTAPVFYSFCDCCSCSTDSGWPDCESFPFQMTLDVIYLLTMGKRQHSMINPTIKETILLQGE